MQISEYRKLLKYQWMKDNNPFWNTIMNFLKQTQYTYLWRIQRVVLCHGVEYRTAGLRLLRNSNISEHHNWCWTHAFYLLLLEISPKSLKWKANKIALVFNLYFNITFEYLKSIIFIICLIKFSLKLLPLDLHRISSVTNLQAATRNKLPGIPTINLWSRIFEFSNNKDSLRSKLFSDSQYQKKIIL